MTLLPIDGSVFLLFTWVAYSICFLVYGSTRLFSLISPFPSIAPNGGAWRSDLHSLGLLGARAAIPLGVNYILVLSLFLGGGGIALGIPLFSP